MAITPEDVITWGSNEYGQCGHGDKSETTWVKPRSIKMLHEQMVTQVGLLPPAVRVQVVFSRGLGPQAGGKLSMRGPLGICVFRLSWLA